MSGEIVERQGTSPQALPHFTRFDQRYAKPKR